MTAARSSEGRARPSWVARFNKVAARLVPRLTFEEPLESQFRGWYAEHTRSRVRNAMWIAMGNMLVVMLAGGPFHAMRTAIFGPENELIVDVLRFAFVVPSSLAMLVVSYTHLYRRMFAVTAQIVAVVHALSFVLMDILMQPRGYSLSSWMPLVVLAPYFLFGMLHAQAVRTSALTVAAYAIGGALTGVAGAQRLFDTFVIAFSCVIGGAVHYSFQRGVRRNYLAKQVLSESANRDSLTGIHNRRMFDEHMQRLWQQGTRERAPLALLLVDLDHFKAFNDRNGHQAGDACLVKVASLLSLAVRRPLDLAARYGGEEFAVLLYDVRRERVEEICRLLHASLQNAAVEHPASSVSGYVTFSIGAACVEPNVGRHPEGFIQLADEALYAAKERGRNRTVVMDREYETLTTGAFRVPRRRGEAA
jgi:diguanylate cyclase (GGDEF)-like protein